VWLRAQGGHATPGSPLLIQENRGEPRITGLRPARIHRGHQRSREDLPREAATRRGRPAAETLLLLAIKAHDYEEHCAPALRQGRIVLEGRSLHCVAVYQSLILHPDDDEQAFAEMLAILETAARWRPLPDLTILITDDPSESARRAEQRDERVSCAGHRHIHHRAAAMYDLAAAHAPGNVVVIDRRGFSADDAVSLLHAHIITSCQQARAASRPAQVVPRELPPNRSAGAGRCQPG
jgi:thymidylate kinase